MCVLMKTIPMSFFFLAQELEIVSLNGFLRDHMSTKQNNAFKCQQILFRVFLWLNLIACDMQ